MRALDPATATALPDHRNCPRITEVGFRRSDSDPLLAIHRSVGAARKGSTQAAGVSVTSETTGDRNRAQGKKPDAAHVPHPSPLRVCVHRAARGGNSTPRPKRSTGPRSRPRWKNWRQRGSRKRLNGLVSLIGNRCFPRSRGRSRRSALDARLNRDATCHRLRTSHVTRRQLFEKLTERQ